MKAPIIDSSRIEAMMAQLKAAAAKPSSMATNVQAESGAKKVGFGDALKGALDQVNGAQKKAEELGQAFVKGDDKVSLSDVMISMQKANITFQGAAQVRNKLVSAYHDIMNMQV